LQDDPTQPLTGDISSTSLLGTQGDAGHVEQRETGPSCDFGNIDLSHAELQGWLRHVNDVRNLLPMPKEQLQNPTPLEAGVWVGSLQHAAKIGELRRCGVRAVVNMVGAWWKRGGLNYERPQYPQDWDYLEVHAQDELGVTILQDHFAQIYGFMQRCHRERKPIFVYCRMGINRSVTVCVAFLMCLLKWSLPQALHHVLYHRPLTLTNVTFQEELIKLAKVNGLLHCSPKVNKLVREVDAPLHYVWQAAQSGKHESSVHVDQIIDTLKHLGAAGLCLGVLQEDLEALSHADGLVSWEQFKDLVSSDVDTGVRSSIFNLYRKKLLTVKPCFSIINLI